MVHKLKKGSVRTSPLKTPKKSKYGAIRQFKHGYKWASKLELSVFETLKLMERCGKIRDIKCQVHVRFHTHDYGYTKMIPDFSCFDCEENQTIFVEAKGFFTREYLRKEKAWAINGPGILFVYGGSWKYPKLIKKIVPKLLNSDK